MISKLNSNLKNIMTTIHDTIHSEIEISEVAQQIIDHPFFERCNLIMQTGNAVRVFPSATHSRKIHQIGCYHVTMKMLQHLQRHHEIDEKTIELISIGALCHDIGHLCGSHNFDYQIIPLLIRDGVIEPNDEWITHEKRSIVILKKIFKSLNLKFTDSDIEFISNVIEPNDTCKNYWQFQIVCNKVNGIDTDRMDYILRDSHMIGLHSKIDVKKIIHNTRIINNEIQFNVEIEDSIRELLFARYMIHKQLTHENVIKFDLAQRDILINGPVYDKIKTIFKQKDVEELCKLTDIWVLENGDPEYIKRYFARYTYQFIKSYKSNSKNIVQKNESEIAVHLKIHICKNKNLLDSVKFYSKKTMQPTTNSYSAFDSISNDEHFAYVFSTMKC